MDDSDHSTSLSFVTRRRLLMGTALSTLAWPFQAKAPATATYIAHKSPDPALLAWEEWKTAALRTEALCHKQQRLETTLVREIGFPRTTLRLPESSEALEFFSPEDIEAVCGSAPEIADLCTEAKAALAEHQARWDVVDEQIGYSATKQAEVEAGEREQELVEALTATPATSLAGVAGKLDMIFHEGTIWEDDTEFPQPQILSALRDLIRLGQALEPNVVMPGSDRETSRARQHVSGV